MKLAWVHAHGRCDERQQALRGSSMVRDGREMGWLVGCNDPVLVGQDRDGRGSCSEVGEGYLVASFHAVIARASPLPADEDPPLDDRSLVSARTREHVGQTGPIALPYDPDVRLRTLCHAE
jgi:hypothetical protein